MVLDLDGDGIELYELGTHSTYFDLRNSGRAVLTGWVAPDDGLLVFDANENGWVDNASELFGSTDDDSFAIAQPSIRTMTSLLALLIQISSELKVWRDENSDGISQSAELHSLTSLGITEIDLNADRVSTESSGNEITHVSTFVMNGGEHAIVDAWFSYDSTLTRNSGDYTFDIRTAFLPTLKGFGELKDLHIAASGDNDAEDAASLIHQLADIASETTITGAMSDWEITREAVEDLLLRWAGVGR